MRAILFVLMAAAGVAASFLIAQGNLAFVALPLVMALLALGLSPRAALAAGAVAAIGVVAKFFAVAFGLAPLSGEWLSVIGFVLAWAVLLGAIALTRRSSKLAATALIIAAAPVFIVTVVPVTRALDTMQRSSVYIPMRDAVKIAADVYVPRGAAAHSLPTILQQTRYFRRTEIRWPYSLLFGGFPADIHRYIDNGYAYVKVDARGSGASFGSRAQEWSDDEIRDGSEVVDWIVKQPWSSGKVGSTGVSYDGTAAEMLLASHNPAVKACAPRFSLEDPYVDIAFPGGIHLSFFTDSWGAYNDALDRNAIGERLEGFQKRIVKGIAPVDGFEDLLPQAVADHRNNYDVRKWTAALTYRDDAGPDGLTMERVSPFAKPAIAASGVPISNYSGWYDGGYQRAAISRYLSYKIPGSRLIVGPWDHGGRQNISPHAASRGATSALSFGGNSAPAGFKNSNGASVYDQTGELIRFFDFYLKGTDNGFGKEKPVHYYTMGEEAWKEADTWPPASETHTLYLAPGHALGDAASTDAAPDEYKVDLTATTGLGSRWQSYFNLKSVPIGYPDRAAQDKKLLVYDSAPLADDTEITGHAALHLWVASNAQDGEFFVYLEDVGGDGSVTYITEGQLRALTRAEATGAPPYWQLPPVHSFLKADSKPLIANEPAELSIALLPTSYRVPKGHKVRVALAGADVDQFAPLPGDAPAWRVFHDTSHPSRIELPVPCGASGKAGS